MIKSKKQSFIVIGVFVLVLMLGTVTYAFFNYTRTGTANTIRTGQINFLTTQGNTINLTNVFPTSSSEVENNGVTLRIEGDTTYSGGEEFEITLTEVNNTIGSGNNVRTIPINYVATYTPTSSGENIGSEAVSNYFSERGSTTTVYELTETGVAENGKQVLVGYIPANGEIDGTLTIKAYLDASNIVISDTYPEEETDTNNDGYLDGTPASFGEGKTVLTTAEWNALQNTQTPLSFKIKAISQEGTWVEEPALPEIASCPGCKFIYPGTHMDNESAKYNMYSYGNNGSTLNDIELYNDTLVDDYTTLNKSIFLGFKIENDVITKAYVCGIKPDEPNQGTAFCLNATENSVSSNLDNVDLLSGSTLWNDTDGTAGRCNISTISYDDENVDGATCGSSNFEAHTENNFVMIYSMGDYIQCQADAGTAWCGEPG